MFSLLVMGLLGRFVFAQDVDLSLREPIVFKEIWERSQASGLGSNDQFRERLHLYRTFAKYGSGTGQLLSIYYVAFKPEKERVYYFEITPMWPDPGGKDPDELQPHGPVLYEAVKVLSADEALGRLLQKGVVIPEDPAVKQAMIQAEIDDGVLATYRPDVPDRPMKAKVFRVRILTPIPSKSGKKYASAEFNLELAHATPLPKRG